MDLADIGAPEEEEESKEGCEDKSNNICIDISLIMGKMGGNPHEMMGKEDEDEDEKEGKDERCVKNMLECEDDEDVDWKSIAKQLLQAVSMMDTHTDGVNSGTEDPDGALKAIDNETSRVLWGKQDDSNPRSSYQNANYGETTANGLVMTNPAELCNKEAFGEHEPQRADVSPDKHEKPPMFGEHEEESKDDSDDLLEAKDDKLDKPDDAEDIAEDKAEAKAKGFPPKPGKFKQAAEGIIKKGAKSAPQDKFDDDPNDKEDEDDQYDAR